MQQLGFCSFLFTRARWFLIKAPGILVVAIGAVFTAAFTTIPAFEVVFLGENDIPFFVQVIVLGVEFLLIAKVAHGSNIRCLCLLSTFPVRNLDPACL